MRFLSWFEKIFVSCCLAALFCSCYYLSRGWWRDDTAARAGLPVGQIAIARGDTRWKSESQSRHYRTWEKQKLFDGDAIYVGPASRMSLLLGPVTVDLQAQTRLTIRAIEGTPSLETQFGRYEVYIPAGERIRVSSLAKFLDLSSVNGGRVGVEIETDKSLKVQNISGDLVVRTEGKSEFTIPEEEIFSSQR